MHHEYEFGGPLGTGIMMVFFPLLLYYLYVCLVVFDGWPQYPRALDEILTFFKSFYVYASLVHSTSNFEFPEATS